MGIASSHSQIVVDGTYGEGGGALLRAALVMSSLTEQPLKIVDVRGGTRYPGLDSEDISLIRALGQSCAANTAQVRIGDHQLSFIPTRRPVKLETAVEAERNSSGRGPNALVVLTSLLPVLAKTGAYSTVVVEGETYGVNSLSYDAFAGVTLPALKRFGLYAYPDLRVAGFGRESSGSVALECEPCALQGVEWTDRGPLKSVQAMVTVAGMPPTVGERIESHLRNLARTAGIPLEIEPNVVESDRSGVHVSVSAAYERGFGGGSAMGGKGIRAEAVAQSAFEEMLDWMSRDATVDPFLADQILIPAVFASTSSIFKVSRITERLLTTVWVVKQFAPIHITVRGSVNGPGSVSIKR